MRKKRLQTKLSNAKYMPSSRVNAARTLRTYTYNVARTMYAFLVPPISFTRVPFASPFRAESRFASFWQHFHQVVEGRNFQTEILVI